MKQRELTAITAAMGMTNTMGQEIMPEEPRPRYEQKDPPPADPKKKAKRKAAKKARRASRKK